MAVTCARCGTPNPDNNQYCQACGSPLSAAPSQPPVPEPAGATPPWAATVSGPPPGPQPSYPPWSPTAAPPGPPPNLPPPHPYQNPYYTPSEVGPQPTVHRTPWILIAGAVVGLVVLMAACGAGIALLGSRSNQTNSAGIKPSPLPSPSPAGSPNPSASPTASPTATPFGGPTASNANETVTLPSGWVVVTKDNQTITLTNPSGNGSITIGSGPSSPPQTAQQNKDTVDRVFTQRYPDTKDCPGTQTTTGDLDGATGIFWQLCFTLTSGGQSLAAGAPMFAGANSDGSVYYAVILITNKDNMDSFIGEARPVLLSIQWKLH